MSANERMARAEARRRSSVLHRTTLRSIEEELDPIEGPSAISLLTTLSAESWSATGAPFPDYPRDAIPVRFVRGRPT